MSNFSIISPLLMYCLRMGDLVTSAEDDTWCISMVRDSIRATSSDDNSAKLARMAVAIDALTMRTSVNFTLLDECVQIFLSCEMDTERELDLQRRIALMQHEVKHAVSSGRYALKSEKYEIRAEYVTPVIDYAREMLGIL